jgi:DNA-binding MarR family transcriptional regulator
VDLGAAASESRLDGQRLTARKPLSVLAPACIRPAHGNVMQFLDDDGTTVSGLAQRAQITKQSMAELVEHLERLGYVERVPDPSDRRAKLVRATPRGRQLYAIAREVVVEIEAEWTRRLGKAKMRQLRELLEELNAAM